MRLAFIAIAFAFAADVAGQAPKCQLARIAEWPLRADHYRPVVDGEINGQKVGVLLNTGNSRTMIRRAATERLRLPRQQLPGYRAFGVGGETHVEAVNIEEFRVGKSVRKHWRTFVTGEHTTGDDIAVVLGDDFFGGADIEFDLRNNAVRFYQAKDCAGAHLAYWSPQALAVPLDENEKVTFTVAINGKPLRAELDSGVGLSILAQPDAEERGVTPSSPGAKPAGCVPGLGGKSYDSWTAPFDTFAIGDELIRNPQIRFADLWRDMTRSETGSRLGSRLRFAGTPQMLLGADFLRSHRVLIARSQKKMYFTYEGGTVFQVVTTPRGCDAPSRSR
jgi:hypothetical protein